MSVKFSAGLFHVLLHTVLPLPTRFQYINLSYCEFLTFSVRRKHYKCRKIQFVPELLDLVWWLITVPWEPTLNIVRRFIIQTIKRTAQHIFINNILHTVSTSTCFNTICTIFRESWPCALLKLPNLLKLQFDKSSRLKCFFVYCFSWPWCGYNTAIVVWFFIFYCTRWRR